MRASFFRAFAYLALLFMGAKTQASPVTVYFNPGMPIVFADVNSGERVTLKSFFSLQTEVVKGLSQLPLALGVYYQSFMASSYGFLPVNNSGLSVYYFPFGAPIHHRVIDGNVEVAQKRLAVFVKLATGLTFMNFRNGNDVEFGASAFNYVLAAGFDYPMWELVSFGVEAAYISTLGGQSADNPPVNVGITGFVFSARFGFTWP